MLIAAQRHHIIGTVNERRDQMHGHGVSGGRQSIGWDRGGADVQIAISILA